MRKQRRQRTLQRLEVAIIEAVHRMLQDTGHPAGRSMHHATTRRSDEQLHRALVERVAPALHPAAFHQ